MGRHLVTADDVPSGGTLEVPPGALVTPLARDLARRRGVLVRELAPAEAGAARLVIANWKSYKTPAEALTWASALAEARRARPPACGLVVCPPAPLLPLLDHALAGAAALGAQDLSPHDEGAHTGEVAARLLVAVGCSFALVGHSERRAAGEGEERVRAKVRSALRGGLRPVLCVGETAEERRAGRAQAVVAEQLRALGDLEPDLLSRAVVAYEPRWAIGAGVTPREDEIAAMLGQVRVCLERIGDPAAASRVPVLYGGSVSARNAGAILSLPGCAGALVGGASLDAAVFAEIAASA